MKRKPRTYDECHKTVDSQIYKLCSDCDKWLPMTRDFYYLNKSASDGHNPYCKECTSLRSSKYQKDNPEWTKSYAKKIYKKKEQYFKDKAKRWSNENEDRAKSLQSEWRKNNPDKVSEYNEERKLHKKHKISKKEWEDCKNYFNYRCSYCGLVIEDHWVQYKGEVFLGDFHKEHVDDKGANDLSNCVPSCKSCNTSKHTYSLSEWYNSDNQVYSVDRLNKIIKWLELDYKKFTI